MDRDKLKKLIKNEVFIAIQRAFPSCIDEECVKKGIADKHEAATEATDSILSLLAAEIADAEKWGKVKEIAKRWEHPFECCEDCILNGKCGGYCREAYFIVQALEGEGEKG